MGVLIIGAGVIGLTTGIQLLRDGYNVTIWARDMPLATTSSVAAAFWFPYNAFPLERVIPWGNRTFTILCDLATDHECGISLTEGLEASRQPTLDEPWWKDHVRDFRRARSEELPDSFLSGFVFSTPVVEMPIYLSYLLNQIRTLGGTVVQRDVRTLDEAVTESNIVVNCAGLGARELMQDEELFPIRGQVVRVRLPSIRRFYLCEDPGFLAYFVPRPHLGDCILGGTIDVGEWDVEPNRATRNAIIERCATLVPEVREAEVLEDRVGLRPGRPSIHLEAERQPGGQLVVHNYGHGGAGVTLSWGCAEEVAAMLTHAHNTVDVP